MIAPGAALAACLAIAGVAVPIAAAGSGPTLPVPYVAAGEPIGASVSLWSGDSQTAAVLTAPGGGSIPVTIHLANDGIYFYEAVTFSDLAPSHDVRTWWEQQDGVGYIAPNVVDSTEAGLDGPGLSSSDDFASDPSGALASDTAGGGHIDLTVGAATDTASTTVEERHPLCGADSLLTPPTDVCIPTGGAPLGFHVEVSDGGVVPFAFPAGSDSAQTTLWANVNVLPAPAPPPVNNAPPVVTGTGHVGSVLSTTDGSWDNSPTAFAYQWERDGVDIAGANGPTYGAQAADVGHAVFVKVIATNAGGSAEALSNDVAITSLPANGAIAWTQQDANAEIYFWRPGLDATPLTSPTSLAGDNKEPSFSPDGSQIAFISNNSDKDQVWAMNADGSNAHEITTGTFGAEWPAWSPDGQLIAFVDPASGAVETIAPTPPAQPVSLIVTSATNSFAQLAWSPDGKTIVAQDTTSTGPVIAMIDAGTGIFTTISKTGDQNAAHPRFSADGSAIYYDLLNGGGTRLVRYDIASDTNFQLTSGTPDDDRQPVGSPDGTALVWVHNGGIVEGNLPESATLGISPGAPISTSLQTSDPTWGAGTAASSGVPLDTSLASGPTFASAGSGTVAVSFAAVGGSPAATVECSVDGEPPTACQPSYNLETGTTHTIQAAAVDGTQTDATPVNLTFYVPAPRANGDIAFQSTRATDGAFHVFKIAPSGGAATQLTTTAVPIYTDVQPAWAPDGGTIAFSSNPDRPSDLFTINPDGSNEHGLSVDSATAGPTTAQFPAYSPDGSTLAFSGTLASDPSLAGIFTMPADASKPPTLVAATGTTSGNAPSDIEPAWSPDGRRIVFADGGTGFGHSIWIMNADGSDLTHIRTLDGRDPSWAPTNDSIIFASTEGDGQQRIWTMAPDGSNAAALPHSSTDVFYPKYSPDGTKLVYSKGGTGGAPIFLYTSNADGTNEQQLTSTATGVADDFPDWGAAVADAVSGASASLTGDASVGMSGSNDSIAAIPLSAFEGTANGASPPTVNGAPINSLPINSLPINSLPINTLPINTLPINTLPINTLPINSLPINSLPINTLPINSLGGWAAILAGTTLAGVPLQTITLQQVLALDPKPPAIANLHLGDLDLTQSALGRVSIGALALGSAPINSLGFTSTQLADLTAWCATAVADLGGGTATTTQCASTPLGGRSLFELSLEGAPINSLPINSLPINSLPINTLPINSLPINTLDLSASPINSLPINSLPINSLGTTQATPINTLSLRGILGAHTPTGDPSPFGAILISALAHPGAVVDCTVTGVSCTTGTLADAFSHGAVLPSARLLDILDAVGTLTLGDLHFYGALTIGDLEQSLDPATTVLGDLLGLLIRRADVPWESLPPRALSAFDPARPQLALTAHFTFAGTGTAPASVKLELPDGFDLVPGSDHFVDTTPGSLTPIVEPGFVSGHTVTWSISNVTLGDAYTLSLAAYSGTTVGLAQATETISAGGASDSSTVSFSVTDSFEPNNDATALGATQTITPNERVQQSAISSGGDVDFYRIPMPPAGTRINVHLGNLSADYDLALYANQTTSVRTAPNTGAPLQDGTVADQSIDLQGGTNAQLTPTALQDVPDPGIPIVQVSANRGTDDEDVGMVSPGGGGFATIAVFGYNGASSPLPYSLRVTTTPPPAVNCDPRTFTSAGTAGSLPAASAIPSDLNTVFLVNEKRLGDTYGATGESSVVAALARLAGERSLGVSGVVVPVEALAQAQYNAWDANPCDNNAANAVANSIADEIDALKASHAGLKYVVFVGGDDQIPFFRTPDLSRIANESGFAGDFANNEYYGALAGGNLLTDNPYLDTRPIPAGGRQLFIPDLVGGRLVEKPSQIVGAVTRYESSLGKLDNSSAFVSGYDFVTDGSQRVQQNFDSFLGAGATRTLFSDTWSKSDLLAAAFPALGPAAINSWNGHYDNYEALAADGDRANLLKTSGLTGPHALSGGIFFTMGCHAGFQTTDAIVGATAPDALDWAEYMAGAGTGFVGNTGFGLGNTDSVAFSEELMASFARNLDGSQSIGDALASAKQSYYLDRTAFSSYDEKTLSEAELYGLPMYGVGVFPPALSTPHVAAFTPSVPDPVVGATASTSPSQGSLQPLAGTVAQVAAFAATPHFEATAQHGEHGQYFTNDGQVQAPNYRPLQPFVSLPASRAGQVAHGVLIDGLSSADVLNFDPDNVRPTLDLSANEPEPQFADEAWPEKVPTLVSLNDANGLRQSLNLATGQFFTDSATHSGVERQWTQIGGRVTYSASHDFTPPTIDAIDAFVASGTVTFTGRFSDLTETGAAGHVALAQVVYDIDNGGHWQSLPLQVDPSTGAWSGGAAFSGAHVQYFVEACDTAGNCGFSSNKGRYFDAQPLPAQTGSVTLTPDRGPDHAAFYTGPVGITAASTNGVAVSVSVDGGPFVDQPSVTVSGDGAHTIDARGADGTDATEVVIVDGTVPDATIEAPATVRAGAAARLSFACTDRGSGVASCSATQDGVPRANGAALDTSQGGTSHIVVHVTDNAGNSKTITTSMQVVVNAPPTTPGTPTISASPTRGQFAVSWAASTDPNGDAVTYKLLHASAHGVYSTVATGLTTTSFAFSPEAEGTWTYEVVASDGQLSSGASAPSAPAIVDQSPPNPPTLQGDRLPEFGTWFKDTVTVATVAHGDAALADGSPGSGIAIAQTTATHAITANGKNQVTGSVADKVGLTASLTREFDVDSLPPTVTVTCPTQPMLIGAVATASWTATDTASGVHGAASGTTILDTTAVGAHTATVNASDNVGHTGSGGCAYQVVWPFTGFFSPIDNLPMLNVINPGQAVPVKFGLGGNRGLAIFVAGYPAMETISCSSSAPLDVVEQTVTAGNSSLQYDSGSQQYTYVWKTPKTGWPSGACRQLVLQLTDGTTHKANFKAK